MICTSCSCDPCECDLRALTRSLTLETLARAEMVRRHLPVPRVALQPETLPLLGRDIEELERLEPQHLDPSQLLELYLLELIEALKRERPSAGS